MSRRCFLEVYTKHNKLEDSKTVEYWDKYIELIEPILPSITNPKNGIISEEKFYEILPEYKESNFPLKYYTKIDNEYFVFDKQICFKFIVPDTFLMPFKKENLEYFYDENYDHENSQFSYASFKYTTTIKEGISTIESRLASMEDSDFKNGCNDVLMFLKEAPLDSLLVLNPCDIYMEEGPEYMLEEIHCNEKMFEKMDCKQ